MNSLGNLVRRIVRSRWVRTFFGAALLCVIVWLFGPLLGIGSMHPLDSELARIVAIVLILLGWLIENLIHALRASRKEKALVDGVAAQAAADPNAAASAEEVALLTERLKEALSQLKRARIGGRSRRYLYQLPWYMFIGPPGAGKTTALINSGLKFPLAEPGGPHAVRGVGGTRNCDWWFTDQAVLIDTAGRYTTQDSNNAVDSAAWLGFLKLLKRTRARQPLNGVLVAISLSDLASLGEAERFAHARAIRKRILELNDELGVRIPVYVLFTKADLVAGFVEFFDNLGKEDREQVWGMSFPLDDGKDEAGAVAGFGREFDALLERLNLRMLERVHQESDLSRRRLVYGFPQQIASLRDTASEFLNEVFRPSRLEARTLLRGAYFTSGTQDGTPIDRLLGAMAGQFGLQRQAVSAFSGTGRSYFLARAVRDVMFGEAGLVSRDPKVERRQRWTSIAAYSVAAVVLVALTAFWTVSWLGNHGVIQDVHAEAIRYTAQYAELARRGPQDTDLRATLPPLATLRGLNGGFQDREDSTPVTLTFGLYQGRKLSAAAIDAYDRALNALLLPRLLARLEVQLRTHLDNPEILYEALKVYLILGRQGPLDVELVEQWIGADIAVGFPGEDNAELREALAAHLHALLQYPLREVSLNGPLVQQARGILTRQPLAEYVYKRMLRSALVQSLPVWTVADNAGPAGGRVFQLRDGKPLNSGVPSIFTWDGYHTIFLALLAPITRDATEDAWVLGRQSPAGSAGGAAKDLSKLTGGLVGSVKGMTKLRHDVLGLYLDDYTRRWDALLANIALKPFANMAEGLDELFQLSAPDSPLRDLLLAVDAQTQLSRADTSEKLAGQVETKGATVAKRIGGFGSYLARQGLSLEQNEIASIMLDAFGTGADGKASDPAKLVDAHFGSLHDFVAGSKDKPAPLEAVITKIQQIYQGMNQAASAPSQGTALLGMLGNGAAGGPASPAQQLADAAQGVPKPVADMLQTVSQSSSQVTASGASQEISDAWRSKVLPLCQAAFNRYPFIPGSTQDVPLDDFARLLGPGGLVDKFFDEYLKPFVDTTQLPWRWQSADHTKLGLSSDALAEFQHAGQIRDALFPTGGATISVKFQLVPDQLDTGLAQVSFEIGDQRLSYAHGPPEPKPMQWPAANGATQVRLTLTPAAGGAAKTIEENGPWALLRLIEAGHLTPTDQPDKFRLAFVSGAGGAAFVLNAGSVRNPFNMAALHAFRCPAKL